MPPCIFSAIQLQYRYRLAYLIKNRRKPGIPAGGLHIVSGLLFRFFYSATCSVNPPTIQIATNGKSMTVIIVYFIDYTPYDWNNEKSYLLPVFSGQQPSDGMSRKH